MKNCDVCSNEFEPKQWNEKRCSSYCKAVGLLRLKPILRHSPVYREIAKEIGLFKPKKQVVKNHTRPVSKKVKPSYPFKKYKGKLKAWERKRLVYNAPHVETVIKVDGIEKQKITNPYFPSAMAVVRSEKDFKKLSDESIKRISAKYR